MNSGSIALKLPVSFDNDTVIINTSINPQSMNFSGDSVAINAKVNYSLGGTTISNSHISVNGQLSFSSATLTNDSIHLNADMSFSNATDAFSGDHVDVANGVTLSTEAATYTNSVFAFNGNAQLKDANGLTSTGTSWYLNQTSSITSNSSTSFTSSTVVMTGTNSFSASNALPVTNSDITIDAGSSLTASSLTVTGGAIDNGGTLKSSNAVTLTGDTLSMSGTSTISASSFSASNNGSINGSVTMSGTSSITSSNAVTFSGTNVNMSGSSTMTGSSGSAATDTLSMSGNASITVTNNFAVNGSDASLGGNSVLSAGSVTVENTGFILIGDNSGGNAHLLSRNQLQVLDHSSISIDGHNNYFQTNANSIQTASGNVPITSTTGSCGGSGENSCAMGKVYGCATMNSGGAAGCVSLALADVSLTAKLAGADAVNLSWTDARSNTAVNYLVQRSAGNNEWTTLTTIDANAYTDDYQFEDRNTPAGTLGYRIARTDRDGDTEYSTISGITTSNARNNTISLFPNPVSGRTFYLTVPNTNRLVLNVYTLTGQLIMRTTLQGQTQYPLQLPSQLSPGATVVVQAIQADQSASFPLLLR
jgi:hypothetical protein